MEGFPRLTPLTSWSGPVLDALDLNTSTSTSPYGIVINVDKRLRSLPVPAKFLLASDPCQAVDPQQLQYLQPVVRWHEHLIYALTTYSQLVLHRSFFIKALFTNQESEQSRPIDPLSSQYSRSVTMGYECAQRILHQYQWLMNNEKATLQALHPCHIHIFSVDSLVCYSFWVIL